MIDVTYFNDPGCPWGYSATPALQVLRWRYGAQLRWRLVVIGLTESAEQYEQRGYSAATMSRAYRRFRRYGMPFATSPRSRPAGTGRACRALCAVRLRQPELELRALRALQFGWFTGPLIPDEDHAIAAALQQVEGLDVTEAMEALDDPAVEEAYQSDRAEARTAAGSATHLQGKSANSDGSERYTAPSLVFTRDSLQLEAGGFQPVEAYDALICNLDPQLDRRQPPSDVLELLQYFRQGLTTQEIAALLARGNDAPDRGGAEDQLIELVAAGRATRTALADDAVWAVSDSSPIGEPHIALERTTA